MQTSVQRFLHHDGLATLIYPSTTRRAAYLTALGRKFSMAQNSDR